MTVRCIWHTLLQLQQLVASETPWPMSASLGIEIDSPIAIDRYIKVKQSTYVLRYNSSWHAGDRAALKINVGLGLKQQLHFCPKSWLEHVSTYTC